MEMILRRSLLSRLWLYVPSVIALRTREPHLGIKASSVVAGVSKVFAHLWLVDSRWGHAPEQVDNPFCGVDSHQRLFSFRRSLLT